MTTSLPDRAWLAAAILASAGSACKSDAPPQSAENVERTALVAQPCAELELGPEPLDPVNARVFVEVVDVNRNDLPTPIGRWLEQNAVTIRASANLVAFPGVPTSAPWAQCVDAVCADTKRSVQVTAQLPERGSEPMQLSLHIEEAPAEGASTPPAVLLDTTLRAIHQQPAVVPASAELGGGSLVITPYVLRRSDDLQRVLTCKERQKARERQL